MPRLLFEKRGSAIWISHLDLMRLFQRAFKRAGLQLTHTQGYNPRPSVSIALPLSVGVESRCELLDFELTADVPAYTEIAQRLNEALVEGVRVLEVYDSPRKPKQISYLDCCVVMEYDSKVPEGAQEALAALFARPELTMEKSGKNGITQQDLIPLIRSLSVQCPDENTLELHCRICCQNPALNPAQLPAAIVRYLPQYSPSFSRCIRLEIYDQNQEIFR